MRGIDLNTTEKMIARALELAKKMSINPLSIVVLDSGGHVKAVVSQDGVGIARFEIARAKAAAALGMGVGTRQLYELFEKSVLPDRFAAGITGATNGQFIPQPGGVLIYKETEIIGAMGISGGSSEQDETVAKQAIEDLGFIAQ